MALGQLDLTARRRKEFPNLLKAEAQGDTSSLLLKDQWRAANSVDCQKDRHLDAIGNLDERNTAIHAVVLSIKGHCSRNLPVAPFPNQSDAIFHPS